MANGRTRYIKHLREIAEKNGVSVDKAVGVITDEIAYQEELEATRRSTPAERETVDMGVRDLFSENHNYNGTPHDVAAHLGVRPNQGNISRISKAMKRLALEFQKAAE